MKAKNILRTIAIVACAAACVGSAPAAVIVPELEARYASSGAQLGIVQNGINPGNTLVGFAGPEEFRNIAVFRLNTLGITSADVTSASLKLVGGSWNVNAWFSVNIDTLANGGSSDFNYNNWNMYQAPAVTLGSALSSPVQTIDITALFKTALDNSSATEGFTVRIWHNGQGSGGSLVNYGNQTISGDGYFTKGTSSIEYTVIPEPTTWAMLVIGLTVLVISLRRRRAHL